MQFAQAYGRVDSVSGAFTAPVAEMNRFLMNRSEGPKIVDPAPITGRADTEAVWLCTYDGDFYNFAKGPPPGADGQAADWHVVRLSVRVYADGSAELDQVQSS